MGNLFVDILQEKRVLLLLLITLGAVGWIYFHGGPLGGGLKFGIDFSGGLRIPVLIDEKVDPATMEEMVNTIKVRAATFGLTEVRVRAVGDSQIYVEVPKTNPGLVSDIQGLLSRQGVYQGITDGKVAVSGTDIYPNSIYRLSSSQMQRQTADWGVSFTVKREGQQKFVSTVKGKANYPIYMFLDRPDDAIVVISKDDLLANANDSLGPVLLREEDALALAQKALKLDGSDISVYLESEVLSGKNVTLKPLTNKTKAIISQNASDKLKTMLKDAGFVLSEKNKTEIRPYYSLQAQSEASKAIKRWDALGLKSAPILSPDLTTGLSGGNSYQITGAAEGIGQQLRTNADFQARETMAVLKGGALPVSVSIGSVQEVPAPLGQEFLRLSIIGSIFAMICISAMVALRYRTLKVVLPIVLVSVSEVIILVAIIGSFSIDLAAMAGIIAAIGISVDAQIIVTDEILKKNSHEEAETRLENAVSIIVTNAIVATVAMIPLLLFSGLVEIIGFATSTLLGYVLGVLVSRPAYGVIVKDLVSGHAGKTA